MTHRLRFTNNCFGLGEFPAIRELFEPTAGEPARLQVWIDEGLLSVEPNLGQRITQCIESAPELSLTSPVHALVGGEPIKNDPQWVEHILQEIDRDQLDRRSYVVAVGGGAFLDAVGFAAAVSHRGIRLVRFPTTTLSQCDSGVGVKNAVNWFGKKNWKGTFATPWAVVNDNHLLQGLSDRDFVSGFSEAVKVGLLKNPELCDFLHQHAESIANRNPDYYQPVLRESVLLHLDHITRGGDPFEALQARPLDFGHWSAHKLESLTTYGLRHGEAVAIGVALDVAYSYLTQGLPLAVCEQTIETLQALQLPVWHECLKSEAIFEGLEEFRQHLGGNLTVTLLRGIGEPIDVHEIQHNAMREAMEMVGYFAGSYRQTA